MSQDRRPRVDSGALAEHATYLRPSGLTGIEALHARFVHHAYRPHSHSTWTVAVMQGGAARFTVDSTRQRANAGELFVLEPEAVHTGMAAVPEGWAYKVLYVEPSLLTDWAQRDGSPPRAARWVVFRDPALRTALLRAHAALAGEPPGLAVEEAVLMAIAGLVPHLRTSASLRSREGGEHAAVRRARLHLQERWDQRVSLAGLAAVAGLSRFELIRRFSAQNGLTPHAFQRDLRIAHARRLLAGGVPAAEVAASCGFADQPHLSRVFKRHVGVTPGQYARAA
ncbi:MAG TPA: AraC family transcriptional regulator [Solirubrobacteraceae bacterium]|nr:AraC family transcriptional regulator [Solirubrobacteraceae bacterium]